MSVISKETEAKLAASKEVADLSARLKQEAIDAVNKELSGQIIMVKHRGNFMKIKVLQATHDANHPFKLQGVVKTLKREWGSQVRVFYPCDILVGV